MTPKRRVINLSWFFLKRIKCHEIGELLRLFLDIHEYFWDKLLQCSAFLAPINLNSPVALRLKYPYHDIKP